MSEFDASIQPWLGRQFDCACGERHSVALRHVAITEGALMEVSGWLGRENLDHVLVVGDERTMAAAGDELTRTLGDDGLTVEACRLRDNARGEVVADEDAVTQVLAALRPAARCVIAVGAGTVHDIIRFVCHRTDRVFVSVPTAASVDGFASTGAPLVLRGFKTTIPTGAPSAIFADLDVLSSAPRALTAAGFGDMLGKFTSLADWRLGRLLLDEPFCQTAADTTRRGLDVCLDNLEDIAAGTKRGVGRLMEGLLLSGLAMLMVGNSRPASGSEHHLSHFWEMRYLLDGRAAELHGAKVGVACSLMAGLYREIRHLPFRDVEAALDAYRPMTAQEESVRIAAAFGPIAAAVIAENAGAGAPAPCTVEERWKEVRDIADSVPAPERIEAWLRGVGGPATPEDLALPLGLVAESFTSAMYVRGRYSILRLARMLGIPGHVPE